MSEGRRYADEINSELEDIMAGRLWYNEAGEHVVSDEEPEDGYFEQMSIGDWVEEGAYDRRFVIEADKSYHSCMLMLAGGGPTIWLNTMTGMIEYSTVGSTECYPVIPGACDEIDEYMRCFF